MKTFKNDVLRQKMNKKGISGDISKIQISYVKLIDGFKPLFIKDILDVEEIIETNNEPRLELLLHSINKPNLKDKSKGISKYFNQKYGQYSSINKFKPKRHIYDSSIAEFYEAFKFDSKLKNTLFPHVLAVEEMLKKTLIQTLNDHETSFDYLMKVEAYDKPSTMSTMLKVVQPIVNANKENVYPPIRHQVERQLIPPYWLSIQALSFTEVIILLEKLNKDISNDVTSKLALKVFPQYDQYINFHDNGHSKGNNDKTQSQNRVHGILFDFLFKIAALRNWIAHDMPLYLFRIKNANTAIFDNKLEYDIKAKEINSFAKNIVETKHLWGKDAFNQKQDKVKPSIMYMIYILNKFSNGALKTDFHTFLYYNNNNYLNSKSKSEIGFVAVKSIDDKIRFNSVREYVNSVNACRELQNSTIAEVIVEIDELVECVSNGTAYRRKQKALKSKINSLKNLQKASVIKNEETFQHMKKYEFFTQITYDFVNEL